VREQDFQRRKVGRHVIERDGITPLLANERANRYDCGDAELVGSFIQRVKFAVVGTKVA